MNQLTTIDPKTLTVPKLHAYLLAAVAPRPIALASTIDSEGKINLSPFSFFNVFSANPPILIFSPSRRAKDNTTKHTYENVREVPEVVINIVNYPIVEKVSLSSTEYDKGVDEFHKSGLTPVESETVKPPRVQESPVSFECTVDQVIELGDQGGAGNLIISRVTMIHIRNEYLKEDGSLDTTKLDLVARMGENWYCRATGSSLFEIPKPILTKGIGVDQLPESIRKSNVLTANNLGRLGNVETLPGQEGLLHAKSMPEVDAILKTNPIDNEGLHQLAKIQLEKGNTNLALSILMLDE